MNSVFDSIAKGLKEAIDLTDGKKIAAIVHRAPDVGEIRRSLGLTQMELIWQD